MTYEPLPLDTSDVQLPDELVDLAEELALNTHEVWARKRVDEGWTHGPGRDDRAKEHPNIVPYSDLREEDKDYDRIVVTELLKAISMLGYEIRRKCVKTEGGIAG